MRAADGLLGDLAVDMASELLDGLTQLAARDDHAEQAQGIRALLESSAPEVAAWAAPLLDQVAAGTIDPGLFEEGRDTARTLGQAPGTELEAALCVAAIVRGLLGVVHAVVNTTRTVVPDLGGFDVWFDGMRAASTQVDEALRAVELALFAACVTGPRGSGRRPREVTTTAQELVVQFAAQQARGRAMLAALRDAGRNGDAEGVGRVLAADGWLIRRAVATRRSGHGCGWTWPSASYPTRWRHCWTRRT